MVLVFNLLVKLQVANKKPTLIEFFVIDDLSDLVIDDHEALEEEECLLGDDQYGCLEYFILDETSIVVMFDSSDFQ